jgi:hypothetical protein
MSLINIPSIIKEKRTMSDYPKMFPVEQHISHPQVKDITALVVQEFDMLQLKIQVKPGDRVAIAADSRGISNYLVILKTIVNYFKDLDSIPFIVPAMGNQGGATAEGELEIL